MSVDRSAPGAVDRLVERLRDDARIMRTGQMMILALALLGSACSRLTVENYQKLHSGMSYQEVEQVLGRPTRCDEAIGLKSCTWGDEQRSITANFVGDKAIVFAGTNIR